MSASKHRANTHEAEPTKPASQSDLRQRILSAASALLSAGGTEAVTTRAVAEAAGVQTPALYRFFQDKSALLDALVEFGFAAYLASKPPVPDPGDPITALRRGWDLHVEFGLSNPALYRLMYADGRSASGAAREVYRRVQHQISRIARSGRLRLDETRAAQLLQSAACGLVFTLLNVPENERDMSLSAIARDAAFASITSEAPVVSAPTIVAVAVALRAQIGRTAALTEMERGLMAEWLDRIAHFEKQDQVKRI